MKKRRKQQLSVIVSTFPGWIGILAGRGWGDHEFWRVAGSLSGPSPGEFNKLDQLTHYHSEPFISAHKRNSTGRYQSSIGDWNHQGDRCPQKHFTQSIMQFSGTASRFRFCNLFLNTLNRLHTCGDLTRVDPMKWLFGLPTTTPF